MTALYQRVRAQLSLGWWMAIVLAIVALLLTGVGFGSTFASYLFGETEYPSSTFAAATLTTPGTLTAAASGNNVGLSWVAATNGNSYIVTGSDASAASLTTCTSANTYGTSIVTQAGITYTDTNRATATGVDSGDLYCYAIQNAYGTTWTSTNLSYGGTNVGFSTTAVAIANGGTANSIDSTDTITLTFNQTPTIPTGDTTICVIAGASGTNKVIIGDTTVGAGTCATGDTAGVGVLTANKTITHTEKYTGITYTGTNPVVVKITTNPGTKSTVATGPTWTFTPASTLKSTTGTVSICTSNAHLATLCLPTTTTTF